MLALSNSSSSDEDELEDSSLDELHLGLADIDIELAQLDVLPLLDVSVVLRDQFPELVVGLYYIL